MLAATLSQIGVCPEAPTEVDALILWAQRLKDGSERSLDVGKKSSGGFDAQPLAMPECKHGGATAFPESLETMR